MDPQRLDAIFPWIVLAYGALVSFTLSSDRLNALADRYVPSEHLARLRGHRRLALICLAIGGLWTLQDLLLS